MRVSVSHGRHLHPHSPTRPVEECGCAAARPAAKNLLLPAPQKFKLFKLFKLFEFFWPSLELFRHASALDQILQRNVLTSDGAGNYSSSHELFGYRTIGNTNG
jgi:hypothetical protein